MWSSRHLVVLSAELLDFVLCLLLSQDVEDEYAEDEDEVEIRSKPQISKEAPTANVSKIKKKNKGKRKGKSSTSATVEATHAVEGESLDELLERLAVQNEGSVSTSDSATAAGTSEVCSTSLTTFSILNPARYELLQSIILLLWLVEFGMCHHFHLLEIGLNFLLFSSLIINS